MDISLVQVIPETTILYAGILGLMATGLGATCGIYRGKEGISFGDGGNAEMAMRMRRHANFVENVPLALILIALVEMHSVPTLAVHAMGIALVLGRALHWYGFADGVKSTVRGIGAGLTALSIVTASVWNLWNFFGNTLG